MYVELFEVVEVRVILGFRNYVSGDRLNEIKFEFYFLFVE